MFVVGGWPRSLAVLIEPELKPHYVELDFGKIGRSDRGIETTFPSAGNRMVVIISLDLAFMHALASSAVGGSTILGVIFSACSGHESQRDVDKAS